MNSEVNQKHLVLSSKAMFIWMPLLSGMQNWSLNQTVIDIKVLML